MSSTKIPGYLHASPPVRWWSAVLGLVFLALAVAAGQELWALRQGSVSWYDLVVERLTLPQAPQWWALGLGAAAIATGIALVLVACSVGRRTHSLVPNSPAVYIRPVDIARQLNAAVRALPGVTSARTRVRPKKVTIEVIGDSADETLEERISQAAQRVLAHYAGQPRTIISISPNAPVIAGAELIAAQPSATGSTPKVES